MVSFPFEYLLSPCSRAEGSSDLLSTRPGGRAWGVSTVKLLVSYPSLLGEYLWLLSTGPSSVDDEFLLNLLCFYHPLPLLWYPTSEVLISSPLCDQKASKVMGWWSNISHHGTLLAASLSLFVTGREGFSSCLPTSPGKGTGPGRNHTQIRIGTIGSYQRMRQIFISWVARSCLPSPKFWLSRIYLILGWVRVSPHVSLFRMLAIFYVGIIQTFDWPSCLLCSHEVGLRQ